MWRRDIFHEKANKNKNKKKCGIVGFFFRDFLSTMLFAENAEHQGSSKDSLVAKEMYPKRIRF